MTHKHKSLQITFIGMIHINVHGICSSENLCMAIIAVNDMPHTSRCRKSRCLLTYANITQLYHMVWNRLQNNYIFAISTIAIYRDRAGLDHSRHWFQNPVCLFWSDFWKLHMDLRTLETIPGGTVGIQMVEIMMSVETSDNAIFLYSKFHHKNHITLLRLSF